MKLIKDIRWFESERENTDGYSPKNLGSIYNLNEHPPKKLYFVTNRFVLKLREENFSLPDFDHIYINLTSFLEQGNFAPAQRTPDRYHPFFRYIDYGFSPQKFALLLEEEKIPALIYAAVDIINGLYNVDNKLDVKACADYILDRGENAKLVFKQKRNESLCVQIMVRVLDNGLCSPSVRISDGENNLIDEHFFKKAFEQHDFVFKFGSILLGKTGVTIKPKNNSLSQHYKHEPLKYKF